MIDWGRMNLSILNIKIEQMFISSKSRKMEEEKYYIIQTDDWDRYYWEVYLNNELVYIASRRGEAEEYIEKHKK